MAGGFITNSSPFVDSTFTWPVVGPGEGPGGLTPPLFLDKTDARRAQKNFLGDRPPPPPPRISKSGSGTDGTTCF